MTIHAVPIFLTHSLPRYVLDTYQVPGTMLEEERERGHFIWCGQGWPPWGGAVQQGLKGQKPVMGRSGGE